MKKKMIKISIKKILLLAIVLVGLGSCLDDPASPVENMLEIEGQVKGPVVVSEKALDTFITENTLQINNSDSSSAEIVSANKSEAISGEVPIAGVSVSVFELSDYISNQQNATLLATDMTDQNGNYLITDLEESVDLVLIVESKPRQTSIIINTSQLSSGDVNSASSIVSEYWAEKLANGTPLTQSEFNELLQTAGDLLADLSTNELHSILSELVPERFGDGFPEDLSFEAQNFVNTLTGIDFAVCEDIEFSDQSARPGTILTIQNLPVDLGEDPFAWSYVGEEDEIYPVYLGALEDNRWELLVPLHPVNNMDGGNIQVFIESEDAQVRCGDYDLEIEPLEPAPGTFESMIDEFENTAISITEMIGYSRDELLSKNMNELDSYAAVMKSVLTVIGGPEYPGSLRYNLSNHASNEILDLYDAILSELIRSDAMSKKILSGNSEVTFFPDLNPCDIPLNGLASGSIFAPTPEDLDCWMNVNRIFEEFNENEFQRYQDFMRRAMPIVGTIAMPVDVNNEMLLGNVETYLSFMEMMLASFEFLFPGNLLGIDLKGEPLLYHNEDDDTEGNWEATIYAEAKDWEFDILLSIGALPVPGAGKSAGIISKIRKQSETFQKYVELLLNKVQSELQSTGIGEYTFEAQVFGPIDIKSPRDNEFFNLELNTKTQETNTDPFSFTSDQQGYIPQAVGTSNFKIETIGGDVFKGQHVFNEFDLEVIGMNITLAEWIGDGILLDYNSPLYINVGEELALEARVKNAINKAVSWSVEPEGDGLLLLEMPGRENIREVLATDPGRYTVEVESIADTGPREDNNPRRYDRVTIVVGGLNVSNPGCLLPGEASQLVATFGDESVDFSELTWEIYGPGSIDSEGLFTANETGDVEIYFYLSDNPEQTYSINFRIDETCRSFRLSSVEFDISGTCVYFEDYDGASNSTGIYFGTRLDDISGSITLPLLSDSKPTDEAWAVSDPEWQISTAVNIKTSTTFPWSNWVHLANDPPGPFSITIEHDIINNGRTLSGSFKGDFELVDYSDGESIYRIETVEGSFRGATRSVPSECF